MNRWSAHLPNNRLFEFRKSSLPMHIAIVNRWYPPLSHGGVATHNSFFAETCQALGHKVTVIAQSPSGQSERTVHNGVTVFRVPVRNFHRLRRIPVLGKQYRLGEMLLYSWQANQVLREVHRETPVDIVEYAEVNAEGFFWPRDVGKLVLRCHTPLFMLAQYYTHDEMAFYSSLVGAAEKQVIRRAAALTTPSQDMADVIHRECQVPTERFFPIANALDTDTFSPAAVPTTADTITILHVGRMERGKGIDTLVGAIPAVCDQIPQAKFVFVGSDRRREDGSSTQAYMEAQLARYIDRGQVDIRGRVSEEALIQAYHEANLAVVPSVIYESFSYTVAQAMGCGLPVVASQIGGVPETLNFGECGILIPPGDVSALSEALIQLCQDNEKRQMMGAAGRKRAVTEFSAQNVTERVLAVYESLLK